MSTLLCPHVECLSTIAHDHDNSQIIHRRGQPSQARRCRPETKLKTRARTVIMTVIYNSAGPPDIFLCHCTSKQKDGGGDAGLAVVQSSVRYLTDLHLFQLLLPIADTHVSAARFGLSQPFTRLALPHPMIRCTLSRSPH